MERQHSADNDGTTQICFLFRGRHYQNWRKLPALELIQSKNFTLYRWAQFGRDIQEVNTFSVTWKGNNFLTISRRVLASSLGTGSYCLEWDYCSLLANHWTKLYTPPKIWRLTAVWINNEILIIGINSRSLVRRFFTVAYAGEADNTDRRFIHKSLSMVRLSFTLIP